MYETIKMVYNLNIPFFYEVINIFIIEKSTTYEDHFYIKLHTKYNQELMNRDIKRELDIPPHVFFEILNRNNGEWRGNHKYDSYYFKTEEDAQKVIDELEGYLIMEKLVE